MASSRLIFNLANNDADYKTRVFDKSTRKRTWVCPFYSRWIGLLNRAINPKKRIDYFDTTVCDEWLTFSNFKKWMESKDWKGKELDKDILLIGNRCYCPKYCTFVPKQVNMLLCDRRAMRGTLPIGVSYHKASGKYRSYILKNGKQEHIGLFENELEAHKGWQNAKATYLRLMIDKYRNDLEPCAVLALLGRVEILEMDMYNNVITKKL